MSQLLEPDKRLKEVASKGMASMAVVKRAEIVGCGNNRRFDHTLSADSTFSLSAAKLHLPRFIAESGTTKHLVAWLWRGPHTVPKNHCSEKTQSSFLTLYGAL